MKKNNLNYGQQISNKSKPVYWLNSVIFPKLTINEIRNIGEKLKKIGIEVRSGFWPLNLLRSFKSHYITKNNVSQNVFNKILILPSSFDLTEKDIKLIIKKICKLQNK